ncbi:hypothetical protein [Streptomyces barkulensis]|uniref:hypothetical protein n=1 Tax=Streptomyces barkulensis TaxID=1257026 RepID=UPI000C6EEA1E|nr:hypothetical protein [Streptomyces barkulensis]
MSWPATTRVCSKSGSLATTQRCPHPDPRSITEAGRSLSAHLSVAAGPPKPPEAVRRVLQASHNRLENPGDLGPQGDVL